MLSLPSPLEKLSRRFGSRGASSQPTSETKHTRPAREHVLQRAIEHLEEAQESARADLRQAVVSFRTVFTAPSSPHHRERTLDGAWAVFRARRVIRDLEIALARMRSELAHLQTQANPERPPSRPAPDNTTLELRSV